MPAPDPAAAGLVDFKGNYFTLTSYTGMEVNGFGKRWLYAAGLVAGDMPAPIGGPPGSPVSFWGAGDGGAGDVYGQLAYKIGGLPYDRSGEEPAQTLTTGTEFWRDDSTTLSLFGYRGRSTIRAVRGDDQVDETDDTFWRIGAGVQQMYRDLTLSAVWMEGRNSRPYGTLSDIAVRSRAWHVEALYQPLPWLLPFARYEVLDLDIPPGVPGLGGAHAGAAGSADQDIARLVLGGKALLRPNVALVTELGLYNKGAEHQEGFDGTLMALFQISF
jgi:hypothetical protein